MPWKRGDVVLVDFPFIDRHGSKFRPALVVSSKRFHTERPQDVIIAVISTRIHTYKESTDYPLQDWKRCGLHQPSVVRSTLFTILSSRVRRKVGKLTRRDMEGFENCLRTALF